MCWWGKRRKSQKNTTVRQHEHLYRWTLMLLSLTRLTAVKIPSLLRLRRLLQQHLTSILDDFRLHLLYCQGQHRERQRFRLLSAKWPYVGQSTIESTLDAYILLLGVWNGKASGVEILILPRQCTEHLSIYFPPSPLRTSLTRDHYLSRSQYHLTSLASSAPHFPLYTSSTKQTLAWRRPTKSQSCGHGSMHRHRHTSSCAPRSFDTLLASGRPSLASLCIISYPSPCHSQILHCLVAIVT